MPLFGWEWSIESSEASLGPPRHWGAVPDPGLTQRNLWPHPRTLGFFAEGRLTKA